MDKGGFETEVRCLSVSTSGWKGRRRGVHGVCVGVVMGLTATAKGTMTGIRTRVIDFILKQDARDFILRVAVWVVCVVGADVHVGVEAAGLDGELKVS